MKRTYRKAMLEIVDLDTKDIILASGEVIDDDVIGGGDVEDPKYL